MTQPWLTILGIGADGPDSLSPVARQHLDAAEIIVTAKRTAGLFTDHPAEVHTWPVPFDPMFWQLEKWQGKKIVILATGDPLWHGVGSIIARKLKPDEYEVIPTPSAFSLAAARLGWPLSSVETLTLHGHSRPSDLIIPFIQPDVRLLALTSGSDTIHQVVRHLTDKGFGHSIVHVLEDMGMPTQNHHTFKAQDTPDTKFSDFNTLAIECRSSETTLLLPRTPGLPDEAYQHDGQLTKQDIRATTVSVLGPTPGKVLWDVGAGCGSIAIEWMRTHSSNRAIAFENNRNRIDLINANAETLGVPFLDVVSGKAPECLKDQIQPDAIFIGGGITTPNMVEACWQSLRSAGRLVANCVTTEGKQQLLQHQKELGGDLVEFSISSLTKLGSKQVLKPALPVLQWRINK